MAVKDAAGAIAAIADTTTVEKTELEEKYGVWFLTCEIGYDASVPNSPAYQLELTSTTGGEVQAKATVSLADAKAGKAPFLLVNFCPGLSC